DARDALSDEQEDELPVEDVEPAPLETPAPAVSPVAAAAAEPPVPDNNWVSYEEYVASSAPAQTPVPSQTIMPAAPMSSFGSSTGAVAKRPKFEKALMRTKQSAIVAAVLCAVIIVAGIAGLPVAVGGISLLGSITAAVVTVVFGI